MPPVMSTASVSLLAVVAGRSTPLLSGPEAAMIPTSAACRVISDWGSAARAAGPGAGAGVRIPEAGAKAVLLGSDCIHLAGEVLDPLQQCAFLWRWANASECRLGCNL
jgi:hypothetical protein